MYIKFGSLWIERPLYDYRDFLMCRDVASSHPYTSFFDNRMVLIHPSHLPLGKDVMTSSPKADRK